MPDDRSPEDRSAADQANAEEIKRNEATQATPRGNVYSEAEEGEPGHEAPPPLPG